MKKVLILLHLLGYYQSNLLSMILIVIDRPGTTIWGSTAAAPLFSEVAKVMIDYFDIKPDQVVSK